MHVVFVSLAVVSSIFCLTKDWVTVKIDKQLSIDFPEKADRKKSGEFVVFTSKSELCVFIVTSTVLPDKVTLESTRDDKFLDGLINGSLKPSKAKGIEKKDSKIHEISVKEATYSGIFPGTEVEMKAFKHVFCVGHSTYVIDCWILDEEDPAASEEVEKFFTSIVIAAN